MKNYKDSYVLVALLVITYSVGVMASDPVASTQPSLLDRLQNTVQAKRIAAVSVVQKQTLNTLNSLVPNFAQQVRTTKKSLESALQYVNTLMAKLAIPEKMSLAEAQAHSQYLEAEIRKLEGQQSTQPLDADLDSLTSEQIRQGIKEGQINPANLTKKQIEDAYGIAQEDN